MARSVSLWRDARGFLHETETAADNADQAFEIAERRDVVRAMLVNRIRVTAGGQGWPFRESGALADWLMLNWPAIKAIGYAFRVDELVTGDAAVAEAAD